MTANNTETPLVNNTGMDYNTDQPKMSISEYGRNVYRMIDHCLTIEDREERNRCARTIVKVMAILNPSLKDFSDFEHKLWDHLFIISGYKLDVDAPFPKPEPELFHSKPEALKYPQGDIRFKHYGKNLEALIQKACQEQDPKNRQVFTNQLAQLMKKHYLNWNRDSVNDQLIVQQLEMLSAGELKVAEDFRFLHTSEILPKNAIPQNQVQQFGQNKRKNNNHKGGGGHKKFGKKH